MTNQETEQTVESVTKPKTTRKRRDRVKLISQKISGYWIRCLAELVTAHGLPKDPNGDDMVVDTPSLAAERKAARAQDKAARSAQKLALESMSPAEKEVYLKSINEAREARKLARIKAADEKLRLELLAREQEAFERGRRAAFEEVQSGNVRITVPAHADA